MAIPRDPVSQQTRRRSRYNQWIQDVQSYARQQWPLGEEPFNRSVKVTITYYHENRRVDVDNLAKPILDALEGVAYEDDSQVTDLLCQKRNLASEFTITISSGVLLNALLIGGGFLHIQIEAAPIQGVIS